MYNHANDDYKCPICKGIGASNEGETMIVPSDIFYEDEDIIGVVNSFFAKNNPGAVIFVPKQHYENVYELPDDLGQKFYPLARKTALIMKKEFKCDGVTIAQNNEPAGSQHAFHYHLHVIPRYTNDKYYTFSKDREVPTTKEKAKYADILRQGLLD